MARLQDFYRRVLAGFVIASFTASSIALLLRCSRESWFRTDTCRSDWLTQLRFQNRKWSDH